MRKDGDNRYAEFKSAQKILNKEITSKEFEGSKAQFLESKAICFELNISWKKNSQEN